jgi:hypothetical protein
MHACILGCEVFYKALDDLKKVRETSNVDISDEHLVALHAALDKKKQGSVSAVEFTQAFTPFQGDLKTSMQRLQTISGITFGDGSHYRITDLKRARENALLRSSSEIPTRYGRSAYFDTRLVTEPGADIPCNPSYQPDSMRFRTSYNSANRWGSLDLTSPQVQDALRSEKTRNYRLQRIKWNQEVIQAQQDAGERAADEYDRLRLANKAIQRIEYEERVKNNER